MARCDRKANPKAIPSFRVSYLILYLNTYNSDYRDSISLSMTLFPSMANFAYLYVYIGHRSGCLTGKNENRCNRVRGGEKIKTLVNPERRGEKALFLVRKPSCRRPGSKRYLLLRGSGVELYQVNCCTRL